MKTVLLCGGLGTRISEETSVKPKPMIDICGHPMLYHIMGIYESFGFNDFTLALGYKGEAIKEYFLNYYALSSDISVDLANGDVNYLRHCKKDWKIDLIHTGKDSMTGGRLHRLEPHLRPHGTFMLTYGDGLSNINIKKLVEFHKQHGKIATVTAVRPAARFGCMSFNGDQVIDFKEKPHTDGGWINGGFFVFEPEIFDYLHGDDTVLESAPLEKLAKAGELMSYKHEGFWQCMDTLRDKNVLEALWETQAPWRPESLKIMAENNSDTVAVD